MSESESVLRGGSVVGRVESSEGHEVTSVESNNIPELEEISVNTYHLFIK